MTARLPINRAIANGFLNRGASMDRKPLLIVMDSGKYFIGNACPISPTSRSIDFACKG
ncbi:hypothetical protein [Sphingobium sp. TomTYG75]|jgi:hypothetical protein